MASTSRIPAIALCALLAWSSVAQAFNPQPPEMVSRLQGTGQPANVYCGAPRFDASNRFLAFTCDGFLVGGDANSHYDTFLLDRATGVIELISLSSAGQQVNYHSGGGIPSIDGNEVVFSSAGPLHPDFGVPPGYPSSRAAIYLRHRDSGQTELISRDLFGSSLFWSALFYDANLPRREVLFTYDRDIRVPPPYLPAPGDHLWIRNWETGAVELISNKPDGTNSGGGAYSAKFSADGRYVFFVNGADDLGPPARVGDDNIYVRDRQTGSIERLTYPWQGGEFQAPPPFQFYMSGGFRISADGRFVVFSSSSRELHPDPETLSGTRLYLLDRQTGEVEHLSSTPGYSSFNAHADISDDGRYVAWASRNFTFQGPANPLPSTRALWVLDRHTGQRVNVAESLGPLHGDTGISLELSGDGSMIAFTWRLANPAQPNYFPERLYTVDLRGPQPYVAPQPVPTTTDKRTLLGIAALLLLFGLRRLRRRKHVR